MRFHGGRAREGKENIVPIPVFPSIAVASEQLKETLSVRSAASTLPANTNGGSVARNAVKIMGDSVRSEIVDYAASDSQPRQGQRSAAQLPGEGEGQDIASIRLLPHSKVFRDIRKEWRF